MPLTRKSLSSVPPYSIDLVTKDAYTFAIQIMDHGTREVVVELPLDPMDNTLAGVIDKTALEKLGVNAEAVLNELSTVLQAQIGAKEFVILPAGANLPGYLPAEQVTQFGRLRHASRQALETSTLSILNKYKDLTVELNMSCGFVAGMSVIEGVLTPSGKAYDALLTLLENHANFTPGKMNEYKEEQVQGSKARFNNGSVLPIALLDSNNSLRGVIRVLSMGNGFAYISDETIDQEIIPLDRFQGETLEAKQKNRSEFLLAYLLRAACVCDGQEHFLLIAASGRVDVYEALGLQVFPILSRDYILSKDYVVTAKPGAPGPLLTSIKVELVKPFSNASAMSSFGVLPMPSASAVMGSSLGEQHQGGMKHN